MAGLLTRLINKHALYACCLLAQFACGQENGLYDYVLPANTARLFMVQQLGDDVSVIISREGGEQNILDHLVGRTGPELFLAGPFPQDSLVTVAVSSPSRRNGYMLDSLELAPDSPLLPSLRTLTEAGIKAANYTPGNQAELASLYAQVAEADISDFGLSAYAGFNQARLLYEVSAFDEALAVLDRHRDNSSFDPFAYKVDVLTAEILFAQDKYSQARGVFESALETINALDLPRTQVELDIANLELTLGFAQLLTGAMDEGKSHLDSALEIGNRYMDAETLGNVHNNLGGYYSIIPDFENSVRHFNLAIDYLRGTGASQELIYTLENLGLIYGWMGEYRLARETTHLALSLAEKRGVLSELSGAYTSIVSLYNKLGEYQVAEELSRMAMDIDLDSDREWRAVTMMNIHADALIGQNKTEEAIDKYLQALAFFREDGTSVRIMTTYQRLIAAYLQANELEQAEINLQVARALGTSFPTPLSQAVLERFDAMEAELALAQGRPGDAINILEQVLEDDYDSVQPEQLRLAELMMQAYRDLGNLEGAITYGDIALDFIDRIRTQLDFARLGPAWSEKTFPIYLQVVDNLMQQYANSGDIGFARKAYAVSEKGLAFNLAQQRLTSQKTDPFETEASKELRQELALLARARTTAQGQEDADLEIDYFRTLERYQASLGGSQYDNSMATLVIPAAQQQIAADTLLLEYVCVPGRDCYAFAISRDGFVARQIGSFDEIDILASAVQTEVRSASGRGAPASRRLGNLLFSGVSDAGIGDIRVVANYPLNAVPMAALGLPDAGNGFEPVISKYRVTSLPSVSSALLAEINTNRNFDYELSVLADPEFSGGQPVQLAALGTGVTDTLRGWYDGLSRLPWSAREAQSLESIYDNEPINVMTGLQASKANLLDESTRNSRVIHIASHGYFNTSTPDLVGIATSPQEGDSGFVSLEELMMYPFNAELVVISGCETGLGDQRGGEGMISLARGFLGQGVDHVISTLWPVSDRASAEFMKLFYEALHTRNQGVAEALQSAQVALSARPEYSSPFYWSPYVLTSLGR